MNNGKKTHSSEIDLDVALTLLKGAEKAARQDQTEADDDNFWKNPVNQTTQIKFAEESPKEKIRYGGNITYEELSKHKTPEDAWIAVDGKVYDVTKYSPIHPGGKKINLGFGKDATALYSTLS